MKLCILVLFALSCKYSNINPERSQEFYEYYDFNSLEGIGNVRDKNVFPYVSIQRSDSSIIINHYINKDSIIKSNFNKTKSGFERTIKYMAGMTSMEFTEIHNKDTTIIFMYESSVKKKLSSISIFKSDTLKTYTLKGTDKDRPLIKSVADIRMQDMYSTRLIVFDRNLDTIIANIEFNNLVDSELSNTRTIKFQNKKNKPIDWWLEFGWNTPEKSLTYLSDGELPVRY